MENTLTPFLSSFFILLREGFEAMLIAVLVFMYLDKVRANNKRPAVFWGIAAGIVASMFVALGFKKIAEDANKLITENEILKKKYYTKLSSVEFKILVNKKVLIEFKRFKKRASERERTSKINAFEMKNRSGAQNIKEKLLKSIRGKSNWSCPYCANMSDVNVAEADHIHPVNKGGLTTLQNMVLICKKCNSKKTNLMLRIFCKKQGYDYNGVCERLEKLGKDV